MYGTIANTMNIHTTVPIFCYLFVNSSSIITKIISLFIMLLLVISKFILNSLRNLFTYVSKYYLNFFAFMFWLYFLSLCLYTFIKRNNFAGLMPLKQKVSRKKKWSILNPVSEESNLSWKYEVSKLSTYWFYW